MAILFSGNLSKHFSQAEYHPGNATVYMTKETRVFVNCIEEFRTWLNAPMYVYSWARTKAENVKLNGHPNSNHLQPRSCAQDWHLTKTITKDMFITYAKKWAAICKAHGTVGEAGFYDAGWVHFGIQNSQQAKANGHKFVHWHTLKNGTQINNPYPELRGL